MSENIGRKSRDSSTGPRRRVSTEGEINSNINNDELNLPLSPINTLSTSLEELNLTPSSHSSSENVNQQETKKKKNYSVRLSTAASGGSSMDNESDEEHHPSEHHLTPHPSALFGSDEACRVRQSIERTRCGTSKDISFDKPPPLDEENGDGQ